MAIGNANGISWLLKLLFNIWPYFENIGRLLKFTDSTDIIDQIGDETRKLEPDRCIVNDKVGGGVVLESTLTLTKWAVAFRISNYVNSWTQYTVGTPVTGAIEVALSSKLGYREKGNFSTFPTFDVKLADGDVDILMYSDNEYVYAYYNGNYVGKLAKISTLEFDIQQIINSVSSYQTKGNHYDYRIWDLDSLTAEEINTYFQAQAPNFHSDTMVDDANFEYHRYLMNEGGGLTCFDSGTAAVKINGTYFYDDITKPVSTLHDTTNYPEILKNRSNREGYTNNAGIIIPKDLANTTKDVQGNDLQYSGIAKMNAKKEANGNIDFNPDQLESYVSYEDNTVTDPSFDDGTKWTGVNWADGTGKFIHSGTATDNLTSTTANPATIGKEYRLTFEGADVTVTYGGNTYLSGESHVATTTDDLAISSNVDAAEISLILIQEVITHDDSTTSPTEIGELAFSFFNQLAYSTNPFNITSHFTDDIIPYINWSDVYSMTPELFNLLAEHPEYVLEDYRGYWYKFYNKGCGTTLTDSVIYKTKKTVTEQTNINNKKGCPTYTGLS